MNTARNRFPERPALLGTWAPIYMEPTMGSGERFTVAVAAVSSDGFEVTPAIREEHVRCLWGKKGLDFLHAVQMVVDSLREHLARGGQLENWESPLSGVHLGQRRVARGHTMGDIIRTGVEFTASFSVLEHGADEAPDQHGDDRWPSQVQLSVTASSPLLAIYFDHAFRARPDARPTRLNYMSAKLVANLDKLVPGARLSATLQRAKAKLLDLQTVRDHHIGGPRYELILYRPPDDAWEYTARQITNLHEALGELDEAGGKHDLRVVPVFSVDQAAARILQAEAA